MNHLSYLYHNLISTQHLKDKSISIIVLFYNLILTAREGIMGNCHPEKTNVDRGEAEVYIGFSRGDNFQCYPFVQSIIIIEY